MIDIPVPELSSLTAHPFFGVVAVGACAAMAAIVGWRVVRGRRPAEPRSTPRHDRRGDRRGEDLLTFAVAVLATGVAAQGMWKFFHHVLGLSGPAGIAMFAFLELAMFTSALRARRNAREFGSAGADGVAVWVFTVLSALFSATDADSFREVPFRLAAPLVAAWLWERGMSIERRRTGGRRIHWRITPERVLVRLGVAEARDRSASDVDVHRRLTRVAKAAHRVRRLRQADARPWRQARARARLDKAMTRAVEHAGLSADAGRQQALVAQLGALYNAHALAELTPAAPWEIPHAADIDAERAERLALAEEIAALHTQLRTQRQWTQAVQAELDATRTAAARTAARLNGTRTGEAGTDGSRTAIRTGARTPMVDRAELVAELAEEISSALQAGERYKPDYRDLRERSGMRQSWCEKVVGEARRQALAHAFPTAEDKTRTDEPATSPDHEATRTDTPYGDLDDARTDTTAPLPYGPDEPDTHPVGTHPGKGLALVRGER